MKIRGAIHKEIWNIRSNILAISTLEEFFLPFGTFLIVSIFKAPDKDTSPPLSEDPIQRQTISRT